MTDNIMPEQRIPSGERHHVYFLTITVNRWLYILDRPGRWDTIADAIEYYRGARDLRLFGFVFMINHLHLIAGADDTAAFLRDFKRYTARVILADIAETEPNIRDALGKEGLWQRGNAPKMIETDDFFYQKLAYIHDNPGRKGYVAHPEYWYWSSANPACRLQPDPL
jgi:REP element-mobilizing transposase RayT